MFESKLTVLDNEFVSIWCYPTERILHHEFYKYVFGDTLRAFLLTGVEAFEAHGCTKWLSDDRKFGAILPEDKEWGDKVWRPRILAAEWKYWAMVLPSTVTGKMNIQKMVDEYRALGVSAQFFSTPEEAMTWLLEQG